MNFLCCNDKSRCSCGAIIASIIIGIIAAFLRITAVITVTPVFLFIVLGIAVVYLAITPATLAAIRNVSNRCCLCSVVPVLLAGILGTILTAVILLAIPFAATSILGAIIAGILLASASLMIISVACLSRCAISCLDDRDNQQQAHD